MRFCRPVGPGEEHTTLAGLPTKPVSGMPSSRHSGLLQNVYAHTAGGGKFLGILQVKNNPAADEGRQGRPRWRWQPIRAKNIILVDEDVDIFDMTISCGR